MQCHALSANGIICSRRAWYGTIPAMEKCATDIDTLEKIVKIDFMEIDKTDWLRPLVDRPIVSLFSIASAHKFGNTPTASLLLTIFERTRERFRRRFVKLLRDRSKRCLGMSDYARRERFTP